MYLDKIHDIMIDRCYGGIGLLKFSIDPDSIPDCDSRKAQAEDLMDVGIRVDIDPDSIPDTDSREDFLQLTSLERTIENFRVGEYSFAPFEQIIEDFELWANENMPVDGEGYFYNA